MSISRSKRYTSITELNVVKINKYIDLYHRLVDIIFLRTKKLSIENTLLLLLSCT